MNLLIFILREIILLNVTLVIHSGATTRVPVLFHVLHLGIGTLVAALLDRARAAPKDLFDRLFGISHHSEILIVQTVGCDEKDHGFLSDPVVIQSQV
jgi:hypothetical protein